MQRIAAQNEAQPSRTGRRTLIGSLLLLCVLCAGATAVWVNQRAPSHIPVSQAEPIIRYSGHRSSEVPISSARSLSMMEAHAPTTAMPWDITLDPAHGYVWVAEPGCEPLPKCSTSFAGAIGQYAYSDGTFIQDFTEPNGYTSPLFVVIDSVGHLWFTQPNSDAIGEFDPINNTWQQWPLKKGANPYDITLDERGNVWFTEYGNNAIGFFDTKTHVVVETPIPTPQSNPYGIAVDKKGEVWFAENSPNSQIGGFMSTADGKIQITEHVVNALRPHLMTTDDAGNVWMTEGFQGSVTAYNPVTGTSHRYQVYTAGCTNPKTCTGTHISGIDVDSNGNVWFSDSLSHEIGYLVPDTGQVFIRTLPANSHPHDGLILDKDGRLWFTEQNALALDMWPISSVK